MSPNVAVALAIQRSGLFQSVFPDLKPTNATGVQMGPAAPAPVRPTRENTPRQMTGVAIATAKATEKLAAHLKLHPPKTEKPYVRPTRENTGLQHTGTEIETAYREAGLKMPKATTTVTPNIDRTTGMLRPGQSWFQSETSRPDLTNKPLPAANPYLAGLKNGSVGPAGTTGYSWMFQPPPSAAQMVNPKMTALPQTNVMLNTLFPSANPLLR